LAPEPDILIVGIGNRYRNDDGVGLSVIDKLQESGLRNVELIKVKPDGYSLLETWLDRELVIIVDAAAGIGPVGTVKQFDALNQRIPSDLSPVSTHSLSLAETVSLGKTLDQLPEKLFVFAVESGNFDHGSELSEKVREAVPRVVREISGLIDEYRQRGEIKAKPGAWGSGR